MRSPTCTSRCGLRNGRTIWRGVWSTRTIIYTGTVNENRTGVGVRTYSDPDLQWPWPVGQIDNDLLTFDMKVRWTWTHESADWSAPVWYEQILWCPLRTVRVWSYLFLLPRTDTRWCCWLVSLDNWRIVSPKIPEVVEYVQWIYKDHNLSPLYSILNPSFHFHTMHNLDLTPYLMLFTIFGIH